MNQERDRFLTEQMGWCWHDYDPDKPLNTYSLEAYVCNRCKGFILGNNDFGQEEDFLRLWNRVKERRDLQEFLTAFNEQDVTDRSNGAMYREKFADELYALLKARQVK